MDENNNFDWILQELEGIAYEGLSESLVRLLSDAPEAIYGIALVNGQSVEVRYQTREGLAKLAEARAASCNVSAQEFENLLRWQVDTFNVDEKATLSKVTDLVGKVMSRVQDLLHEAMDSSSQAFSEAYAIQNEVDAKIKQLFCDTLTKVVTENPDLFKGASDWPVGVTYQEYYPNTQEQYRYMEGISGKAVVVHYKALGVRSLVSVLDAHIQDALDKFLKELADAVFQGARSGFEDIIQEFSEEAIYWLCLYHNGDCTSYVEISFATERGLDETAQQYARHSQLSFEDNRKKLRWSPCDSPHHCEKEESMEEVDGLLSGLEGLLMDVDENLEERLNLEPFDDLMTEAHGEVAELVHQLLITQLKRISETPVVSEYVNKTGCVLWVTAGDTSHNAVDDIALIHNQDVADRVADEMEASLALSSEDSDLQDDKVKADEENPPELPFSQSDFDEIVDDFNPTFFEKEGCVFGEGLGDMYYPGGSKEESSHNRYELLELLKTSPYYDDLDKLYGHFIGVEFKSGDFLPVLARRFVKKLEDALRDAYPDKCFVIYLEVSRGSRYRFEFYQNRQDGFTAGFKSKRVGEGVFEYRLVGNIPLSVKVPIGLYKHEGRSYAMAFGIPCREVYTDKSVVEHSVTCEGKDYDEACWLVREAVLEHFNRGYHEGFFELDGVFYPPAAVPEPSQGLRVTGPRDYYDEIEYWRMIEVIPDFLTDKVVQD